MSGSTPIQTPVQHSPPSPKLDMGRGLQGDFEKLNYFDDRLKTAQSMRRKYSDRVPIVAERMAHSVDMPVLLKSKFLVPRDLTVGQFLFVLRKQLSLPAEKALFLFVGGTLPTTSSLIRELETLCKPDGFLYIQYSAENTFG